MYSTSLEAIGMNWICDKPNQPFECYVKCRYRQPDQKAVCEILENGNITLINELAYTVEYINGNMIIVIMAGTRENFYQELKRKLR